MPKDRLLVIRRLLAAQLFVCLLVALIALLFGWVASYSALLGGLICLVPNSYFAYRTFRFRGARAAKHIIRSFYQGEAVKLGLTAVMFACVFAGIKPLAPLALFVGYLAVQVAGWVAPLFGDGASGR